MCLTTHFLQISSFINLQYTSYFTCFISSKSLILSMKSKQFKWKLAVLFLHFGDWSKGLSLHHTVPPSYNTNKSRCSLLKRSRIKKKSWPLRAIDANILFQTLVAPTMKLGKKWAPLPTSNSPFKIRIIGQEFEAIYLCKVKLWQLIAKMA